MNRRNFFFSLASFSALLSQPSGAVRGAEIEETEILEVNDQIRALEDYVKNHPEPFPWTEHNELRHLYGGISEQKSMRHADVILAHSLMDDYILGILSEWQLEGDPAIAAINLMKKAEKFPTLLHLRAACLIKAGDLCREHGREDEAGKLYRSVAEMAEANKRAEPGLRQYATLAGFRLGA